MEGKFLAVAGESAKSAKIFPPPKFCAIRYAVDCTKHLRRGPNHMVRSPFEYSWESVRGFIKDFLILVSLHQKFVEKHLQFKEKP